MAPGELVESPPGDEGVVGSSAPEAVPPPRTQSLWRRIQTLSGLSPTGLVDEIGRTYFDHLAGEFRTLADSQVKPVNEDARRRGQTICTTNAQNPERLAWGDLYSLELAVLQLQPLARLRARAESLRTKWREVVGQAAFDDYLKAAADLDKGDEMTIRADLEQLLSEFHWLYTIYPARERVRSGISKTLALVTLWFLLVLAAVGWWLYHPKAGVQPEVPTVLVVIAAGVVGSFVSAQQRIQSLPNTGDSILTMHELKRGRLGIFIAPLSGAIFATALYLIFAATLAEGALFPKIFVPPTPRGATSVTFGIFAGATGPSAGVDYAKLIVWSFIAGFAERFVPDALDRLIAKSQAREVARTP